MAPLAVQAWLYDRVDWLEGAFAIISTGISCASEFRKTVAVSEYAKGFIEKVFPCSSIHTFGDDLFGLSLEALFSMLSRERAKIGE